MCFGKLEELLWYIILIWSRPPDSNGTRHLKNCNPCGIPKQENILKSVQRIFVSIGSHTNVVVWMHSLFNFATGLLQNFPTILRFLSVTTERTTIRSYGSIDQTQNQYHHNPHLNVNISKMLYPSSQLSLLVFMLVIACLVGSLYSLRGL